MSFKLFFKQLVQLNAVVSQLYIRLCGAAARIISFVHLFDVWSVFGPALNITEMNLRERLINTSSIVILFRYF